MRFFLAMFLACAGMVLIACGGDDLSNTQQPTEAGLRATVAEYHQTIIDWDAGTSYPFFSADLRSRCPYSDWVAFLAAGKLFLGENLYKGATTVLDSVRIEDGKGFISGRLERDGIELRRFPNPEKEFPDWWIWENGQWRINSDDPTPCDISD